eukprot:CAMPEP_0174888810 /NCGR_PEP_ID=MMETSP0167-20121228/4077_1 /TAXON_ID=38298 /ORGANISM="Rhodella maculata, Strain CCMP736" /LENGTH=231 /DNA_ID=CAMNT_0016125961 /DNA_START=638 /DNA_END=1333 /DNA_ORIENTATION=+
MNLGELRERAPYGFCFGRVVEVDLNNLTEAAMRARRLGGSLWTLIGGGGDAEEEQRVFFDGQSSGRLRGVFGGGFDFAESSAQLDHDEQSGDLRAKIRLLVARVGQEDVDGVPWGTPDPTRPAPRPSRRINIDGVVELDQSTTERAATRLNVQAKGSRARGAREPRPAGDAEGDASDIVRPAQSNPDFAICTANPAPAERGGSPEHAGSSDDPHAETRRQVVRVDRERRVI